MKVPLEWLQEFVTIRLRPEQLAHRLTMAGFEVTAIERVHGEWVFSVEITPNRADCLSIMGIAREVAAITGAKLTLSEGARGEGRGARGKSHPRPLSHAPRLLIRIEDRQGCRRYIGRLIEGIRIGASPAWMQKRLVACGLRPINNVVDITNYVLLEYGQPLHAFDDDRLLGGAILVRRAKVGEELVTIDETPHRLSPEMLVIADAKRPVAVAGVMGGRDTQVAEATKRVLLESAWFDPTIVRRTARALGLASESSYRFERGVDPIGVESASKRAAALLTELAGGVETAAQDAGGRPAAATTVLLEPSKASRWLGVSVPSATAKRTLEQLGFSVKPSARTWRVSVPSYRRDVQQDVDLIEEIARLSGYDALPATHPCGLLGPSARDESPYTQIQELRRWCTGLGLSETITWALVSKAQLDKANCWPDKPLQLQNPLSLDHLILRPTLLIGLLQVISKNLAQGIPGVRFFELGHVFTPKEIAYLGIGIAGLWERSWQGKQPADVFRLKGVIDQLLNRCTDRSRHVQVAPLAWAEPGHSLTLQLDGKPLGVIGQVARRIREAYDIEQPVWFGEINVEALLGYPKTSATSISPSPFPPAKRDLSFLIDKRTPYTQLLELIRATGSPLAHRVELVDRYVGSQVPETKHSLTFSIEYRDPSRTLTAGEVDALHRKIREALAQRFGAQLR